MRALRWSAWGWIAAWYAGALVSTVIALRNPGLSHFLLDRALLPVSLAHPLGCDTFGRDLGLLVLSGSLLSSVLAVLSVIISCVLALAFGTLLAFLKGNFRFAGLRGLDLFLSFPSLLFALGWAAFRGPGWGTLIFALTIGTAPPVARLVYARTRELLDQDYVTASRSMGADAPTLIKKHVLPGVLSLLAVKLPNLFAGALLSEATLTFLGIGAPLGRDTWGSLLLQGKDYLIEAPHIAIAAGVPLVFTVLALQSLSEGAKPGKVR